MIALASEPSAAPRRRLAGVAMNGWVILVDHARDFPNAETPHKVITTSDYLARPKLFAGGGRAKIINLSRSYNYQSKGYYASLLAEARGHRIIPSVETMLELRERKLYEQSLPDLQEALTAPPIARAPTRRRLSIFCSASACRPDPRFEAFGRLLFDWYRCPAIEVTITPGKRWKIDRLRARPLAKLGPEEAEFFRDALHRHTERDWRNPRARSVAKYSLAVLYDPQEAMPPSSERDDPPFPEARREAFGRRRAADQAPARRTGRIRRPVHPRHDLDRQLHLPLRAPRAAGGYAGHRRSGVDDPLHQQGLSARTDGSARRADPADRHAGRGRGSRARRRSCSAGRWW